MSKHTLLCLTLCLTFTFCALARAGDDARALVEKAIKAHGGEANVAKLQAVRTKSTGTLRLNNMDVKFTAETCRRVPERNKSTLQLTLGDATLPIVQVHNGKQAWSKLGDNTEELKDERLTEMQNRSHQFYVTSLLPLLKDKGLKLSPLGEAQVEGRPALGVRVSRADRPDVNLFFDKESHLLVKSERTGNDFLNQKQVQVETLYRDYKETAGVKQPMRLLTRHDGETYMEMEITELRFEEAIDDSEFARP